MADTAQALFTGYQEKKAAGRASDAQTRAFDMGIDESRRQQEVSREILNPYVQAGYNAIGYSPQQIDMYAGTPSGGVQYVNAGNEVGGGKILREKPSYGLPSKVGGVMAPTGTGLQYYQGLGQAGATGVQDIASGISENAGILGDVAGRTGRNLDITQQYAQAGMPAFQGQQDLIGLGGPEAERAAIASIQEGPEMQALLQQGENRILQNASATGGMRGGNTQAAMAQFAPQILNSLIDKKYSRLGGISDVGRVSAQNMGSQGINSAQNLFGAGGNMAQYLTGSGQSAVGQMAQLGQASAAGTGSAAVQTGQGISNLMGQIGSAQAGAEMARARPYQMFNQAEQSNSNMFGKLFASYMGGVA